MHACRVETQRPFGLGTNPQADMVLLTTSLDRSVRSGL